MIFFLKVYLLHERNPQKKRVWNLPLFDFLPFTNNGGDHFANVGRVVQESIQHFFLWDFLCKQMNIYVELRIIWDKAKFIGGGIWKTKMGTNDLISESYWNILEQNMFCKCQRRGIRTRSGGKIGHTWSHLVIAGKSGFWRHTRHAGPHWHLVYSGTRWP